VLNEQLRQVERPPREQLLAEIAASSWSAVGRKYGVSEQRRAQVGARLRARGRDREAVG
jgi:hypothetical protein